MRNLGRLTRLWRREFWVNFWLNLGENSRQMLNFCENLRKFQRNLCNLNATLLNFKANSWQSVDCHDFARLRSQSLAMTRYRDFHATYEKRVNFTDFHNQTPKNSRPCVNFSQKKGTLNYDKSHFA